MINTVINTSSGVYKKRPGTPDLHVKCNLASHKMPKIQPQTKVLIIKSLKTKSAAEVADTFNVSKRQVERIRKRFEETGVVHEKPSGKPRKTTVREDRSLLRQSRASPFSTAAQLHEKWLTETPVSTRTVCQILSRSGSISAQKPALNKRQLKYCVAFVKAHSLEKGWTMEKWQKVDFSDESSIELHSNRRKHCRRPVGTRMDPRCRVDGNINSRKYQEILAAHYIPNYNRGQILQQDGAPSHTSASTSKFLKAKKVKVLQDWPAQSPDVNIIEHVWDKMKEEAWKMKPKNLDEL